MKNELCTCWAIDHVRCGRKQYMLRQHVTTLFVFVSLLCGSSQTRKSINICVSRRVEVRRKNKIFSFLSKWSAALQRAHTFCIRPSCSLSPFLCWRVDWIWHRVRSEYVTRHVWMVLVEAIYGLINTFLKWPQCLRIDRLLVALAPPDFQCNQCRDKTI